MGDIVVLRYSSLILNMEYRTSNIELISRPSVYHSHGILIALNTDMVQGGNSDLSTVLNEILNSYGLDEETRRKCMEYQKMMQLLKSWHSECVKGDTPVLLSSSAYETTSIDCLSSDVDIMYIVNSIRVIDNIQQWVPDSDKATYMMDNTSCYKTFVKLYLLSNDYP